MPAESDERALKPGSAVERLSGMLPWTGDPEELHRFLNDPDEGMWGPRDI